MKGVGIMKKINKNQKARYGEQYFNNIKSKELVEISFTTPQQHEVTALICRKHNRYLGSLLILEVDDKPTEQFIQGMPKIHYLDNYHMIKCDVEYGMMNVYEKLDGTNICLYGLKNHKNELVEVVPKSRNMGMLDAEFYKLYKQTDTKIFTDYIKNNPDSIIYLELYGMGNLHMIKHLDTYLDVKLLGLYDGENFVKDNDIFLAQHRRPSILFNIHDISQNDKEYKYYVRCSGLNIQYKSYSSRVGQKCHNMNECVSYIKESLNELNEEYEKANHRLAVEGVVIDGVSIHDDAFTFIKVKPESIELAHKSENGIPRQYIMKEIMKYLDEHRSSAKNNWESNPEEVMEYINSNLSESFKQPFIDKSQNKIKRLFESKIIPQPIDEDIKRIGDSLIQEYPDKSITDLMRIFGQNYPNYKKSGGKLYKYLEGLKQ